MTSAHQRLVREYNLRMEHFDLVLQHLGASLKELGVPDVSLCARNSISSSAPETPFACSAAESLPCSVPDAGMCEDGLSGPISVVI